MDLPNNGEYFVEWNAEHPFKKNMILVNIGIAKKTEGVENMYEDNFCKL